MSRKRIERLRTTAVILFAAATLAAAAGACSEESLPTPTPQPPSTPTFIPHNPDSVSQLTKRLSDSQDNGQPTEVPQTETETQPTTPPEATDETQANQAREPESETAQDPTGKTLIIVSAILLALIAVGVAVIICVYTLRRTHDGASRSET